MMMSSKMSGHKSAQQQCYEYLLFGSVSEKALPALLHRLRGLCDFATTGGVQFTDRELAFRIGEGETLLISVQALQTNCKP